MSNFFERYAQIVGKDHVENLRQQGTVMAQIIQRRHKLGLSQQDLADEIGVAKSTIARIESGHTVPRIDTLQKISKVLGIPLIIDGTIEENMDDKQLMIT